MHILTLTQPVDAGPNGMVAAGSYLIENQNGAALMLMAAPGTATLEPWTGAFRPPDPKNILVIRPGAFGDLIQLTPALRALDRKYPNAHLSVSVNPKFREVLLGLPYIDGLVPYPVPLEQAGEFDMVLPMEFALEHNESAKDMHIVDALAAKLGVEVPENYRHADFLLTDDEKAWAREKYPRNKLRRIAIQTAASELHRTYEQSQLVQVMRLLVADGWEIYLTGEPRQITTNKEPNIVNLTADQLSFRQSAVVLLTCDVALGPDSAILHVCGALGVKALGLFGPFHWKTRTTNHPTVWGIQAVADCAPCNFHSWGPKRWPVGQPCEKTNPDPKLRWCPVLASIEPERIFDKLNRLVPKITA